MAADAKAPTRRRPRRRALGARAIAAGCSSARNGLAMVGLITVLVMIVASLAAPLIAPQDPDRAGPGGTAGAALGRALVRHRRAGPRPVFARAVRRADHAGDGGGGGAAGRPGRPGGGQRGRLPGRACRPRADAGDRRVPGVPAPGAGAGLRRGAEAGHHQRDHRHRADRLAALCAAGARRHADGARHRLHRRGAADRRWHGAHRAAPRGAAVPDQRDRARDAGHERHHPDRGGAGVFWGWARSRRRRNGGR